MTFTVNFEKLYADWKLGNVDFIITNDGKTIGDNAGEILDIKKVNDNTVKLVLASTSALTDNSLVTVAVADDRTNGIAQDSQISFNLVDSDAPKAVKVSAVDYKTLVAEFTEPVNPSDAETISNWVLNGKRLSAADIISIEVGNIINEDGEVAAYDLVNGVDNRHFVTIKLVDADQNDATTIGVEKYKAAGQKNLLQAYNITDYAAQTDTTGQNKATTQEFEFLTPAVPNAPTAAVTMDSPEQFKVEFSAPVQKVNAGGDLTLADFVVERQHGVKADGTPNWVEAEADVDGTQFAVSLNKGSNSVYYIELENDWTRVLGTDANKISYYTPGYNKVKITLKANAAESIRTGVDISSAIEEIITLDIDAKAPTFTAEQVVTADGPQQAVAVTMSEPIKFPGSLNTEGSTPSLKQGAEVPAPTFEFVSADKKTTIQGSLDVASLSEDDKEFVITPDDTLAAGEWTVYIRSISDDVGNTSDTLAQTVTILPTQEATGEARIIWAEAIDNTDVEANGSIELQDVVFVQFGTEMSLDALRSNIYSINGNSLPEGVSITSSDEEYSAGLTGTRVMITLPHNFLGNVTETYVGTVAQPHILNVNKRLADVKGNALLGKNEVQMTYDFDGAGTIGVIPDLDELIQGDKPNPGTPDPVDPVVDSVELTNSAADAELTVGSADDATLTLTAVAKDADGNEIAGKVATFESSNEAVATVDEDGLVTAVGEGTATIKATIDDKEATFVVTVNAAAPVVETVELNNEAADDTLVLGSADDTTLTLTAVAKDADGNEIPGKVATFESSDTAVATVDENGLVTAVGEGTATIKATIDGKEATFVVTVTA
ncbi:Ig-like domain-containing protein [Brevibacillus borstelensis]|uniref:Ig-like domain-containing protein n=1 Tax=Brevibacillus borstelensis TaxID=45462 RepID=UPI00203BEE39|nr:Ig-like domain-containing protein [Brevibacillus borstelensis]MCM3625537.1 Ig-like domain-containing protein [Brevibacillus borstelensis]